MHIEFIIGYVIHYICFKEEPELIKTIFFHLLMRTGALFTLTSQSRAKEEPKGTLIPAMKERAMFEDLLSVHMFLLQAAFLRDL